MRVAHVEIVRWDGGYLVDGQFGPMNIVSRKFNTYDEALKEFARVAGREEVRNESGIGWNPDRNPDRY